jgi:hypothetical protein
MHGADFRVTDEEVAVMHPARALAMTVVDLLSNDAAGARNVLAKHHPRFSKEQYLAFVRTLARTEIFDGMES